MRANTTSSLKEKNISLRIDQDSLDLISLAAKEKGISRSAYMIQATRRMAEKALLDQKDYFLDDKKWSEFNEFLEAPVGNNIKLKKLMTTSAPWDNKKNDLEHSSS